MHSRFLLLIIILFISGLNSPLSAQQNYFVETITNEQGLSQGSVLDMIQDKEGFIWLGTKDGLNRYDGKKFKVFTNNANDPWSISGNSINHIFEDSKGRIWVAAGDQGINIYDKVTGKFHRIVHNPKDPTSISANLMKNIVEDSSGYFIILVAQRELNMLRLEPSFFKEGKQPSVIKLDLATITNGSSVNGDVIKGLGKDAKGRIWVGSEKGTYQLDVAKAKFNLVLKDQIMFTNYPDDKGGMWALDQTNQLFYFDGAKVSPVMKPLFWFFDITLDRRKDMWTVSAHELLALSTKQWQKDRQPMTADDAIFYRWVPDISDGEYAIKSIMMDRAGIVWVGGNGKGLYKINPNRRVFNLRLPGESVFQILPTLTGEEFISNYGIQWFNMKSNFKSMNPLVKTNNYLLSNSYMLISKSGDYYCKYASEGLEKIKRYNPKSKQETNYIVGAEHNSSQLLIETKDGMIWLAGENEVMTRFDPKTGKTTTYNIATGDEINKEEIAALVYSHDNAITLYEDVNGVIWYGNSKGIVKCIRPKVGEANLKVTRYQNNSSDKTSLNYNHVLCFLDDPIAPQKYLWACTKGGGLNKMDKATGKFTHLTKSDGLPDNVVYGILEDSEKNIWGSTNKGLFCMTMDTSNTGKTTYKFRNFSKADGLQDEEFNTGAYARYPGGKLAFGGINGYNVFDPKEVLAIAYHPKTYLTNLLVNNKQIKANDESGILQQTIETSKSITLRHDQDIVTLEFASLDFSAPTKNKYRYQLVGAQNDWVDLGNQNSVTFVKLPSNTYTFRVQGSNSQGQWDDQITTLTMYVLPPWWASWWAFTLYALALGGAIWTYLKISLKRSTLQQELTFEKREAERIKEIDYQKSKFFTNLTHEFRTPLTIIIGMANQIAENPKDNFKEGLDMIARNGQNLLNLVNKMLNLSKLESGSMKLELEYRDVIDFVRVIVESFRSYASHKHIQIHFLSEVDELYTSFDSDKLEQIISNIISNAYKFTSEKGNIYISIKASATHFSISIKDTGRGIPASDLEKVFDRFYQVDNSSTRTYEGTGIGLALAKELVKLMNGHIVAVSPPSGARVGSEFILTLERSDSKHAAANSNQSTQTEKTAYKFEQDLHPSFDASTFINEGIMDEDDDDVENTVPLILLVEDNMDVLRYTSSCLTDYRLIVAHNGQEGFEMAVEMMPDIIVSDVMMPLMDGFEMCEKLKSDARTNHIPVILLTARADVASKLEGLEFGANAYLPKPFEKKELLLSVKNLFDLRNRIKEHYQRFDTVVSKKDIEITEDSEPIVEDKFVIAVRENILQQLDDVNLNVDTLAGLMHLSRSQFARKLDALTGISPNKFIKNLRLNKSKELLENESININTISYECGFNDPSYFSRIFKKEFGMTPLEWREQAGEEA